MSELIVQENFLPSQETAQLVVENFGRKLTFSDLIRWKVPSGGGKRFVNSIDEDTDELVVVLLNAHKGRFFYEKGYDDPDSTPLPDCMSSDGINGHGDPGGVCSECDLNQFIDGTKPCKERYIVLFLSENNIIPEYISIPVTSIKAFQNKVLLYLTSKAQSYKNHIIKMTLDVTTNKSNIKYSKINFEVIGKCETDVTKVISEVIENV